MSNCISKNVSDSQDLCGTGSLSRINFGRLSRALDLSSQFNFSLHCDMIKLKAKIIKLSKVL